MLGVVGRCPPVGRGRRQTFAYGHDRGRDNCGDGVLVVLALVTSSATEEPQAAVSVPRPTPAMNIERPAEPILEETDAQLATQSYSEAIAAFRQADYDKAISMFEDLALELPENARVLQYLEMSVARFDKTGRLRSSA